MKEKDFIPVLDSLVELQVEVDQLSNEKTILAADQHFELQTIVSQLAEIYQEVAETAFEFGEDK